MEDSVILVNVGFTLDSLLKLQSAKAFDKKTSILQYVITLIHRNDAKCLQFPQELSHCAEASRLTLDSAYQEQLALRKGLEASLRVVSECLHKDASSNVLNAMSVMTSFLSEAKGSLEELSVKIDNIRSKFSNVLAYFGEEDSMPSQDFFATLSAFILVRAGRKVMTICNCICIRTCTYICICASNPFRQEFSTLLIQSVTLIVCNLIYCSLLFKY